MNGPRLTPVPRITFLVVDDRPTNPYRPKPPTPAWRAPFIELLGWLNIIDSSQPDPNLYGHLFCFQPTPDLSRLSRIFLSVNTPVIRLDIDLYAITPPAALQLQRYAYRVLQAIQRLKDCLIKHNVIADPSCFLYVDMRTCPLCRSPLASCVDCDANVACSEPSCPASYLTDCEFCYPHARMACRACLAATRPIPPLIRCPLCPDYCCREDVYWCAGIVVEPATHTAAFFHLSETSDWDFETIRRSHPLKPSPCGRCSDHELLRGWLTCRNMLPQQERHRCPSQTPGISRFGIEGAYCLDCLKSNPGIYCAERTCWVCSTCLEVGNKAIEYPHLIICPRCNVSYCTNPDRECVEHITICAACKRARACDVCLDELVEIPDEALSETDRAVLADFDVECYGCNSWMCPGCRTAENMLTCFFCKEWFCVGCLTDEEHNLIERCSFCEGYVCDDCRTDHVYCPGSSTPVPPIQNQITHPQGQTIGGPFL